METATAPQDDILDNTPSAPASSDNSGLPVDDVAAIDALGKTYEAFKQEIAKVIIGQEEVIEQLAIALFARGHALLMGVPGLAKTLLVSSVAETLKLSFNRIQFTPDLMPSDITGTDIIQENEEGKRQFQFIKGPIFSNLLLADEINRAPAKTQAAMLEAMQERHVTALGHKYDLAPPFFVLATQNPVEQEGTYPLPEAQLDRFMFLINVEYPTAEEEKRIARETTGATKKALETVLTGDVSWGAGPRAVQYLILGAKSRAALHGSYLTRVEDLEAVAKPVLGHRVLTNFAAESQGMTSGKIVDRLIQEMR